MKKSSTLWLWGIHACRAALKNPRRTCLRLLVTEKLLAELSPCPIKPEVVENRMLSHMLPSGAVHQGIAMEVKPLPEPSYEDLSKVQKGVLVVLDHVTDPHNVGAILRTAKALGTLGLMMTEHHAPPLEGALAKTASGALDLLPVWCVVNLARSLEELKEMGFWTIGLDEQASEYLGKGALPQKVALVLGAEGEGLRRLTREKCDFLRKLETDPQFPTLNVSVAAALGIYGLTHT